MITFHGYVTNFSSYIWETPSTKFAMVLFSPSFWVGAVFFTPWGIEVYEVYMYIFYWLFLMKKPNMSL